jgi:hypothetical protein
MKLETYTYVFNLYCCIARPSVIFDYYQEEVVTQGRMYSEALSLARNRFKNRNRALRKVGTKQIQVLSVEVDGYAMEKRKATYSRFIKSKRSKK